MANGESRSGNYEGGGSGGGIYLDVDTLKGSGTIQAMGGNGRYHSSVSSADGGSGGGGRVAIYYGASTFPFNNVSVRGGSQSRSRNGGSGTIYLKKDSDAFPDLIFDNDNISATGATVTTVWFGDRNDLSDDPESAEFLNLISRDKARGWFETTPTVVTAGTVLLSNGDLFVDKLRCTTANILNNSVLYSLITTTTEEHSLEMEVTGTLTVDSTSLINVSNYGYLEGRTQDNETAGGATGSSGGSYGGYGYSIAGSRNTAYGDFTNPKDIGSGAGLNGSGGRGGGLVRITAQTIDLDGSVLANGESRSGNYEGGGSGGGIYFDVDTLNGSGAIQARGGNGRYHSSVSSADGGSGGGGRVAIYYGASTFPFNNVSVRGGNQGRSRNGGTGTIYLKKGSDTHPELIFDNDNTIMTGSSVTPLWFGIRSDKSMIHLHFYSI